MATVDLIPVGISGIVKFSPFFFYRLISNYSIQFSSITIPFDTELEAIYAII